MNNECGTTLCAARKGLHKQQANVRYTVDRTFTLVIVTCSKTSICINAFPSIRSRVIFLSRFLCSLCGVLYFYYRQPPGFHSLVATVVPRVPCIFLLFCVPSRWYTAMARLLFPSSTVVSSASLVDVDRPRAVSSQNVYAIYPHSTNLPSLRVSTECPWIPHQLSQSQHPHHNIRNG